jgi:hypothetical protein
MLRKTTLILFAFVLAREECDAHGILRVWMMRGDGMTIVVTTTVGLA